MTRETGRSTFLRDRRTVMGTGMGMGWSLGLGLGWLVAAIACMLAAAWLRHHWVQASGMGPFCESSPGSWPCPWREWVIQAFIHHRLSSTGAFLLAVAWVMGWGRGRAMTIAVAVCGLALCVSAMGLVLYDPDRSAAVIIGALLLGLYQLRIVDLRQHPSAIDQP